MLLEEKIKFIKQELEEICGEKVLVMCGISPQGKYIAEVDYEGSRDLLDMSSTVSIEDALDKLFDEAKKAWAY